MYKEVEHADFSIKKSLKEKKEILDQGLQQICTHSNDEIKFLRNKLFYDDEELYLFIQRHLEKSEDIGLVPCHERSASDDIGKQNPKISLTEQSTEIIDLINRREEVLNSQPLHKDNLIFNNKPKQIIVRTRCTTNNNWAVWDDFVALGDADGILSFVDTESKQYMIDLEMQNPNLHIKNPRTTFVDMLFINEKLLLTQDKKSSIQLFDVKSKRRLRCQARAGNHDLNPGKYLILNKVRNQILFRSHTREFTILDAITLAKIRKLKINIEYALGEMKNFYITEFMDFLFVISDSNDLYLYDINNCIKGKKMNLKSMFFCFK